MVQLSYPYMTTGKTSTTRTFVSKVISLLLNMLSRFVMGFPDGSAGKESACNVGDLDSIPGMGRCSGEGKGYPLQYSGLENSGCWDCIWWWHGWPYIPGGTDFGGVAVEWSLRPWRRHPSSKLRHRMPASKRTMIQGQKSPAWQGPRREDQNLTYSVVLCQPS